MANIQDILFIFMQGFSGAVAGYITNKYAVNMIFKEYTPLKIGGAVKKNKEKFIEEVSELVEKDIINSQTLKGSIKNEEHLLNCRLYDGVAYYKLRDLAMMAGAEMTWNRETKEIGISCGEKAVMVSRVPLVKEAVSFSEKIAYYFLG